MVSTKQDKPQHRKVEAQPGSLAANEHEPAVPIFTRWKSIIWDKQPLGRLHPEKALLLVANCGN